LHNVSFLSLLAEALFLLFADGRKKVSFLPSAKSRKRASASREQFPVLVFDIKHSKVIQQFA